VRLLETAKDHPKAATRGIDLKQMQANSTGVLPRSPTIAKLKVPQRKEPLEIS
jgi:hypothetical protein